MATRQGETVALVINLDWICIEEEVVERLRSAIAPRVPVPKEHITLSTIHTHSAPNTLNFWGWGDCEEAYIESVTESIVHSAELAWDNLQAVEVGFAATESLTGVSRRLIYENHGTGFAADPHGSFDPTMTVARFRNGEDEVGILVHYGAHCTAMGINRLVSRDWVGVMKDRIEAQFGAPVLFLNGAIGDVGPRTNHRLGEELSAGTGDGLESVREVGYRAASDAIPALLSIKEWRSDLPLEVSVDDMLLPYQPLIPLEEAKKKLAEWEPRKDEWGAPMAEYCHYHAVVEAHGRAPEEGKGFRQVITRIGPMAIVPMPGEMFSGISLRIRNGSPYAYTLCCSVTNGSNCYLPTREAQHRGGYEIWVGKAASAYLLSETIDDALVEQNLALLRR
jgi:hypothetical protein